MAEGTAIRGNSVYRGFLTLGMINLAAVFVLGVAAANLALLMFPVLQLLWSLPLILRANREGRSATAAGMGVAATCTFLVGTACVGSLLEIELY